MEDIKQPPNNFFKIYPNPTLNYFKIEFDVLDSLESSFIIIYDIAGREIYKEKVSNSKVKALLCGGLMVDERKL